MMRILEENNFQVDMSPKENTPNREVTERNESSTS